MKLTYAISSTVKVTKIERSALSFGTPGIFHMLPTFQNGGDGDVTQRGSRNCQEVATPT